MSSRAIVACVLGLAVIAAPSEPSQAAVNEEVDVVMTGSETLANPAKKPFTLPPIQGKPDLIKITCASKTIRPTRAYIKDPLHDGTLLEVTSPSDHEIRVNVFDRKAGPVDLRTYVIEGLYGKAPASGPQGLDMLLADWAVEVTEVAGYKTRITVTNQNLPYEFRAVHDNRLYVVTAYDEEGIPKQGLAVTLTIKDGYLDGSGQPNEEAIAHDWAGEKTTGATGMASYTGSLKDPRPTAKWYRLQFSATGYESVEFIVSIVDAMWTEHPSHKYTGYTQPDYLLTVDQTAVPTLVVRKNDTSQASQLTVSVIPDPAYAIAVANLAGGDQATCTAGQTSATARATDTPIAGSAAAEQEGQRVSSIRATRNAAPQLVASMNVDVVQAKAIKIKFFNIVGKNDAGADLPTYPAGQINAITAKLSATWGAQAAIDIGSLGTDSVTLKAGKSWPVANTLVDALKFLMRNRCDQLFDAASVDKIKARKQDEVFVFLFPSTGDMVGLTPISRGFIALKFLSADYNDRVAVCVSHECGHAFGLQSNDHYADYERSGLRTEDVMGSSGDSFSTPWADVKRLWYKQVLWARVGTAMKDW